MQDKADLQLFGAMHLGILAVFFAALAVILALTAWTAKERGRRWINWALIATILVEEITYRGIRFAHTGQFRVLFPLELCIISVVIVFFLLVTHNRGLFQLAYFWGLGGAIPTLLTPSLTTHFPDPLFICYFAYHSLTIIGVWYMIVGYGFRPTWRGLWGAFTTLNVYGVFVYFVNLWLGTNYMFVMTKPKGATLYEYLGPWPWYNLSILGVALLVFFMLYAPFYRREDIATAPQRELIPETADCETSE